MQKKEKAKRKAIFAKNFLLFSALSFVGWLWETVYFFAVYGEFCDRGFLHLPFCPIYGFGVFFIYLLIGTPQEGRFLLKKVKNKILRYGLYFLFATLIPTLLELGVGMFFDRVFDVILWSYSDNFLNYHGYICLSVSLVWGVGITLMMRFVFPKMQKLFQKIPDKLSLMVSGLLLMALTGDTVYSFVRETVKGER